MHGHHFEPCPPDCESAMRALEYEMEENQLDLFVGNIYGGDYKEAGLDKDIVAANFSRVTIENV